MQYFAILSLLNHLSFKSFYMYEQNLLLLLVLLGLKGSSQTMWYVVSQLVFCKAQTFRMVEETIEQSSWDCSGYRHKLNMDQCQGM